MGIEARGMLEQFLPADDRKERFQAAELANLRQGLFSLALAIEDLDFARKVGLSMYERHRP